MTSIVLDPGHGGQETIGKSTPYGGVSSDGVQEKTFTLDLSRRVAARLGGRAVLTRDGDVNLSLASRIRVAATRGASAFVSIHGTEHTLGGARGTSVWVHPRADGGSLQLAHRLAAALQPDEPRVQQFELAVLAPERFGGIPACMVEIQPRSGSFGSVSLNELEGLADRIAQGLMSYGSGRGYGTLYVEPRTLSAWNNDFVIDQARMAKHKNVKDVSLLQGFCFAASYDWAKKILRGHTINRQYYTVGGDVWSLFSNQRAYDHFVEAKYKEIRDQVHFQFLRDVMAKTEPFQIIDEGIHDINVAGTAIDNVVQKIIKGKKNTAIMIGVDGTDGGHQTAMVVPTSIHSGEYKLYFDINYGQYRRSASDVGVGSSIQNHLEKQYAFINPHQVGLISVIPTRRFGG